MIKLSDQSKHAIEILLAGRAGAAQAVQAAVSVQNSWNAQFEAKVQSLLEANDIPDGEAYEYKDGSLVKVEKG